MKSNSDSKKFDWLSLFDEILIGLLIIVGLFFVFKPKYFNFIYKENLQEYSIQVKYSNME